MRIPDQKDSGCLGQLQSRCFFVAAQEAAAPGFELWTPASLKQYEQKMHDDAAADPHHFAVQQVVDFPNDSALLVRREADGRPNGMKLKLTFSSCNPAQRR